MSLYENNLKAFAQHYPLTAAQLLQISENNRFEVFQDPQDPLNVNIYDHQNDTIFYQHIPQQSVLEQVDLFEGEFSRYPVLFIYGVANGLFVKLLLQNKNHQFVIVIEPELELLFVVFNLIDFTKELEERRVHFFIEDQIDFVRASGIFSDSQIKVFSKTYHLEPNIAYYENYYTDSLLRVNSVMTRAIEHVVTGLGNDSIDALTGLEWHLANVSKMVETPTLVELISKIKTTSTAVIVSTGPSLAKQITLLSQIKEHVTILSVDASLPILEKHGIKPDIVCSIERVPITAHFYKQTSSEFLNGIISVVSSISHPVLVDSLSETTMQMNMRPFGYTRYFDLSDYGYVGIGMSAANLAYEIAFHARFKNIILIGQDLAFGDDGQSHSDGHVLRNIKHKESDSYVLAYGGEGTIRTSLLWNMFRNFYETDIQSANENGIVTINATEGGARIHGALELPFKDAIDHYVDQSIIKHSVVLEPPSEELIEAQKGAVEDKIVKMSEYVTSMQQTVSNLFEKIAACTERLDQINANKNLYKVDYDELAGLMGEIDEIKSKFDEPMFADIFIDATQALIVHQELELARIQVRPVQSDDDRRLKMIDWIYAHKTWLFSLAGIMEAERMVIERRGADAYILRDAQIVANRVTGYIVDLKDLSKRFDVDLVIDGEIVEQKVANQLLHHHLLDQPCEGRFNFEIPERFFNNQVHTVIVKDRQSGIYLSSDLTPVILLETMKVNGQVINKTNSFYVGWCKRVESNQIEEVQIFIDDVYIKTIFANEIIWEWNHIVNDEACSFVFPIPIEYFDNCEHSIQFLVESTVLENLFSSKFCLDSDQLYKQRLALLINSINKLNTHNSIDQYTQNVVGFLGVGKNLNDVSFINYLFELLEYFPALQLHSFCLIQEEQDIFLRLFHNYIGRVNVYIIDDVEKIFPWIEIYVHNINLKMLDIVHEIRKKCEHIYSFYYVEQYKQSTLLEFDKLLQKTNPDYMINPKKYGIYPNEIELKYSSPHQFIFYYFHRISGKQNYYLDLNINHYKFVHFIMLEYLLFNKKLKDSYIQFLKKLSSINVNK